jgi:hypothetical protein
MIIRDEFEDEIGRLKIQPSSYVPLQQKNSQCFWIELNLPQAKQFFNCESNLFKAIIAILEN